jgi:hypothetical protein
MVVGGQRHAPAVAVHVIKAKGGSGGIALPIHNLGIIGRWMVILTPRLL